MPQPGGEADKLGNRYEGRWTVFCMIDVMDEKADSIRLETPGEDAFEFFVRRDGRMECHQVKRQKGGRGRWTLSALQDKQVQVLSDFWKSLSNPDVSCVFVSTQDADELGELANRARGAASWTEFERDFLNKTQSGHFNTLRQKWGNCSEIDAFEALKRVRVETVGEDFLVSTIESRLAALVEGDPKTIRIELAELALEKIHQELTAHDLWHYLLVERKYRRRQWGKDPHVLAAVETANNLYISSLRETQAIAGDVIPRHQAQVAFEQLTATKRNSLLVGEAGVGKSGVMLQVLDKLHQQGIPVLAFRVDRLMPTLLPDEVGQQLGLPGSPAIVLASIAQKRDCVLVIDQLDAVSLASGRNRQLFDCVAAIIDQTKAHPNIRLLLACRKFDLENDHEIKSWSGQNGIATTVEITRLAHSTVREVVAKLGLDATRLGEKQLNLLSVPLHLGLLAQISEDSITDTLNFKTANDLYAQFCKHKQFKLRERLGNSVQWTQVVDAMSEYMSDRQILSAPEGVVRNYLNDAQAMASEHILIWYNKQISFFHEGFFDYTFAENFATSGKSLLALLQSSEQYLFRRTQVRQILFYKREADFDYYLEDLRALLTSSDIRFHIKQVVFALLSTLNDPREEEWQIIAPLITEQANPLTQLVWRTLYSSVSWFQLLDSLGIIQRWLRDESEEIAAQTIKYLSIIQRQIPDRVAELVEPFIGLSDAWRYRLISLIQSADIDAGRGFFELFLRLIDQGILDEARGAISNEFLSLIYFLPEQNPELACQAIGRYLHRRLSLSLNAGQCNPFDKQNGTITESQCDEQIFIKSAIGAPRVFVDHVLPVMLRVMELTARQEGNPPWLDPVWEYRSYGTGYGIERVLLTAMEMALRDLAANQPEDFAAIAERQLRHSDFETIQFLLIRAYTANAQNFANEAIDYLCEQPARLKTGYSICAGNANAGTFWATRQLLEAATSYCSADRLDQLEKTILNYYPTWERKYEFLYSHGYAQLVLLDAIALSRHTKVITRRLQELKRKFTSIQLLEPPGRLEPPETIEAYLVGSPIPEAAADKMTDEQWLSAIARYDYNDAGSRFERKGELIGGASQLSHLLESQVKKDPARFASLVWQFPDNANPCYFNAILRGIAEVGIDMQTAFSVCQRCHQLPQRPCGRSIAWLFQKLADLPWTVSTWDILLYYALNDPAPEQELWRTQTPSGNVYYGGDILKAGINSTRGSAVSAIARLIFADKNRAAYFQLPLQQIVRDRSIAVRCCAAEALTAMLLNYDRELAVSLFLELCKTEDALLGTDTVEHFLYYALPTHFQKLAPILERAITSDLPDVVKVGARQACLSSLSREEARSLTQRCLAGTQSHRIAAAEVYVANLQSAYLRQFCESGLIQLFNDPDEKVRDRAAKCFFRFEGEQLGEYVNLVEAFVASPAFESDCHDLIYAFEKTTAKLPDVTCLVCEKFIDSYGSVADIRTRSAAKADEVSELLIRVYSQSQSQALQSRCLDLVDRLTQIGAYGLDKALQQFER